MSSTRHSAHGPNAGFSYQFERALYWLSVSPAGAMIGLETDDDVAVQRADGSRVLEQDKHSVREAAQPFGDRSKDLWNTLVIWLDAIESGQVEIDSAAFHMVTNKVLPECIAKRIGGARCERHPFAGGLRHYGTGWKLCLPAGAAAPEDNDGASPILAETACLSAGARDGGTDVWESQRSADRGGWHKLARAREKKVV